MKLFSKTLPKKLRHRSSINKKEKRTLTEEEKTAIKETDYTPRERAFIMTGWQAGLRRGEILALRKKNIDFNRNIIHVKDNLIFKENTAEINHYTKTDAGIRDVPMPKTLSDFLKTYTESCDDYLFTTQAGGIATKSMYRRMFNAILNKKNIILYEKWRKTGFYRTYAAAYIRNNIVLCRR